MAILHALNCRLAQAPATAAELKHLSLTHYRYPIHGADSEFAFEPGDKVYVRMKSQLQDGRATITSSLSAGEVEVTYEVIEEHGEEKDHASSAIYRSPLPASCIVSKIVRKGEEEHSHLPVVHCYSSTEFRQMCSIFLLPERDSVLEIGCSTGMASCAMAKKRPKSLLCVDVAPGFVERTGIDVEQTRNTLPDDLDRGLFAVSMFDVFCGDLDRLRSQVPEGSAYDFTVLCIDIGWSGRQGSLQQGGDRKGSQVLTVISKLAAKYPSLEAILVKCEETAKALDTTEPKQPLQDDVACRSLSGILTTHREDICTTGGGYPGER
eukprot:gnl/TRDRNA2_/TRDRNA2_149545_c1_seq3.p1 gnl/TRDRNA2_/TRDRNA2_149545_c1~~gnl/TRDRNA2_/TRDRNA2_149545_c1_seq3.p1  ORF type:complete len:378 (-),score=40.83 gnl/TRDRNA2_/TRDRNA2_149545_c1_seq3:213-1178(-)